MQNTHLLSLHVCQSNKKALETTDGALQAGKGQANKTW
jgi:hypothetical protein